MPPTSFVGQVIVQDPQVLSRPRCISQRSSLQYRLNAIAFSAAQPSAAAQKFVKVCGITNPADAELAASQGANLIGMILWPKAKRSISTSTARQIAEAARANGAAPVGVFVDEDAETILRVCEESDIGIAQLHGDGARAALLDLPLDLQVVYVMHADKEGNIKTLLPQEIARESGKELVRHVDWVLMDSLKGGSGESFDWRSLQPPVGISSKGWLLAGGLTPDNVSQAIAIASPTGVDVSSGVCDSTGLTKDPLKVAGFVTSALDSFAKL